jgi:putative ABC transport system permease protein
MSTLARKVLRDIARRPLRNILTLFGVILGVTGVVAIATASQDVIVAQQLTYDSSSQADLAAFTGDLSTTSQNLVERNENVEVVDSRSATLTRFTSGDGRHSVRIFGLEDFTAMRLDVVELAEGAFPSRGEIAFDVSARELTSLSIGDIVAVQRTPDDETYYLTVSGFTKSPATLGAGVTNRATAYASAATVRQMIGRRADNYLLVRVRDRERASQTASEISGLLAKRGVSAGQFDVRDPENFVGARELNTLLLLLRIFSILGAALASFLVANTLSAVIVEETTQIGIIKALGGVRRQITLTYLAYGALLGLAGSVAGFGFGLIAGRQLSGYLTSLTGLQHPALRIRALEILLALGVGLVVTVGAALVPSIRSAGRPAAGLLRSPGIRSEYQHRLFQRMSAPLARVSRSFAVGLRNVMRRPGRSALTVTVVAVAVAAFVSTQALSGSVSGTADELYELYGADGWIFFRRGADIDIANSLAREPAILQAEPWTTASSAFGSTRTDVWGMPVEDPLYQFRLIEGSWIAKTNPPSVVLTSNLADRIDARTGDELELDVGDRRESVRVVGIVDDPSTYLGNTGTGKAFMTIDDLHRLLGRGREADLIALKMRSSDPTAVDQVLADLEERYQALGPGTLAAHSDRESTQQAIGILTQLLRAMVVIVGVVGITGIANTLIINVTERRHEVGVLRAIGARSVHLLRMLMVEGVTLAIGGIVVGLAIGIPVARVLVDLTGDQLFELTFILDIPTLLGALGVAIAAVACVSALPGLIAARLRPIQVLRYE